MEARKGEAVFSTDIDGTVIADIFSYREKPCVIICGQIIPVLFQALSNPNFLSPTVEFNQKRYLIHDSLDTLPCLNASHPTAANGSHIGHFSASTALDILNSTSHTQPYSTTSSSASDSPILSPRSMDTDDPDLIPRGWSYNSINQHYFMLQAALHGNLELFKLLVSFGCKIEEQNSTQSNLAIAAAMHQHLAMLEYMVSIGVNLMDQRQGNAFTVAHAAAQVGNSKILQLAYDQWMKNGNHISDVESTHETANVSRMVGVEGDTKALDRSRCCNEFSRFLSVQHLNHTAAMYSAKRQDIEMLEWLRTHGDLSLDFSGHVNIGEGIWKLAIHLGATDMLSWLHANGFSVSEYQSHGNSVSHLSVIEGQIDLLKWLKKMFGSNILTTLNWAGETPFLVAVSQGKLEIVQWMYDEGISIEDRTPLGRSAVHLAAAAGHLGILNWLVMHGASVHERTYLGYTVACMAAKAGHVPVLAWLAEQGASLTQIVHDGSCPILQAIFFGHLRVLRWMHRNGFSLSQRFAGGMTLVHFAARSGHLHILRWLASQGLSLIETTHSGLTPIMVAHSHGQMETFTWLLELGAP
jgi:ankyrin repeat protein